MDINNKKVYEVWEFYGSARERNAGPFTFLIGKLALLQYELKEFFQGEYVKARYLGSIPIEPVWDDIFQEYTCSMNALNQALLKQGIDPYNGDLPCLNEEKCKEFTNAMELAEFLKEEIDKYQPTKEENELIEYIEFLKEMIDKYVEFYRE